MLVFDMTNGKSFQNIQKWYKQINESVDVPLIIAGNKADMLDDRCVEDSMIEEL
jgi:GTPase SAR1 family protein